MRAHHIILRAQVTHYMGCAQLVDQGVITPDRAQLMMHGSVDRLVSCLVGRSVGRLVVWLVGWLVG